MKPIFDFELAAKLRKEFEEMNSILDYFKTPTLDALSEKAREYNREDEGPCIACGAPDGDHDAGCVCDPCYAPDNPNACPVCHFLECQCNPEPDHDTTFEEE